MTKKLLFKTLLFGALGGLFFTLNSSSNGYSSSSGTSCGNCHGNQNTATSISLTSNIPAAGYTAGQTYNMVFKITNTAELAAGMDINVTGGTLIAGTGSKLKSGDLVHSAPMAMTAGVATFNFTWTAPAASVGSVTFNYVGNAVNNDGNNSSADNWNNSTTTFTKATPTSITNVSKNVIAIKPNPCTNQLIIDNASAFTNVEVLNINGQVCNVPVNKNGSQININTQSLSSGLYILSSLDNGVKTVTKFVKQ